MQCLRIVSAPARRHPRRLPTDKNQVVEPEEEVDDAELDGEEPDGEDAGVGAVVSELAPDSLLAGVFSDSLLGLSLPSLALLSLCFAWLGSFNLFE